MRILMVTDLYPPIIGGLEQHVRNLSIDLIARGHEVAVATYWHAGLPEFEIDQGVRVYRIHGTMQRASILFSDNHRRYAPPFPDPESTMALKRIIAQERPEIVHGHSWLARSFLPLKSWSGAKFVMSLHDYSLQCPKKTMMYRDAPCTGPGVSKCLSCATEHYGRVKGVPIAVSNWGMNLIGRGAVDMFLPVSQAVAQGNGLIGSDWPFQVTSNFVPDNVGAAYDDSAACLQQLPQADFMLFVGALGRHKGIDVLLNAYDRLINPPPLVLIGAEWADTPATFPAKVTVLKDWRHDAVMAAWRRSMIAFVPSIWPEPCPTVAMEAMASGCPVIASRIGGLPDIVADGETGLLVPPGDPIALQQAIERLLADPELRAHMGDAGKQHVTAFYASNVVERIDHVYQALLSTQRYQYAAG